MNFVDLGLPSGTLWAECNVGAEKPEERGDYYKFGEAQKLEVELPTLKQIEELIKNTKSEWCKVNGLNGRKFTSPNGNSIFLRAAGFKSGSSLHFAGHDGHYWASSSAFGLGFDSSNVNLYGYSRYRGQSVRPVKNNNQ